MYSVVEQKGFQFTVSEGDIIDVPLMDVAPDAEITLDKVLLVGEGPDVAIGTPIVEGASVKAKVLSQIKGEKVMVIKMKRRKDYKRKVGHRQQYTRIQITSISR